MVIRNGYELKKNKVQYYTISDWRMYVRTKRLVSSRSIRLAEEQLRRDQAVTTKKTEHATLIGHIGKSKFHQ